jgi:hypothetical protein
VIERIKIKIKWVKSPHFLAGLALFFTSFLFFYDLFQERYLLTERDLAPYFIPPRFFWVESLKQGGFPLWNPYQFSGQPFFANPQHAVLYPLNSLFFLLPFDIAFNAVIILHFFMGGLFTYLLLRDMKVSSTGSLISGLIFMLGGYLLSVHSLLTILLTVTWTPLIMMFFKRAIENPGVRNEALTAIFITISFLGGGIEIVYGNFFVLLLMMIFPLSSPPSGDSYWNPPLSKVGWGGFRVFLIRFKSLLIISLLFISFSAIQLLPFLELWMHSIRGKGITYQEATIWSLAPKDFLLFFLPDVYGYFLDMKKYWVTQCWLKTMYTGGLPFILSAIFFFSGRIVGEPLSGLPQNGRPTPACRQAGSVPTTIIERKGFRTYRSLFLALMIFSLLLSLGQYNPIYSFVYKYIPFFNGIRYPVKFLYIFILVLAITAGLGFERLAQFSKEREKKKLKHLLILLSLLSGFILLCLVLGHREIEHFFKMREVDFPHFNHLSINLYHTKRFFFYLTLFFLLLRIGYEVGWKGWIRVLLVSFLIADLFGNMGFYGKEKSADYFKKTRILEIVTSEREPSRVFSTGKTVSLDTPILVGDASPFDLIKEKHLPTLNMIFRVHDIWGIDVVRLKRGDELYKVFTNTPSISATNIVDIYGVKYAISVTPIEGDPRFELVYARLDGLEGNKEDLLKQNTIKLYRNKSPLQRAWLVRDFRVMDAQAILSTITQKDFDPREEVFLEEEPKWERKMGGQNLPAGRQGGPPLQNVNDVGEPLRGLPKSVEFISVSNNQLSLRVEAERESILVLSDTYYPGWKVFVNGREEKILRANYNFRAVPLSKGVHQVEFHYNPISFKLGAGLTVVGCIGCGMIVWIVRKRRLGKMR